MKLTTTFALAASKVFFFFFFFGYWLLITHYNDSDSGKRSGATERYEDAAEALDFRRRRAAPYWRHVVSLAEKQAHAIQSSDVTSDALSHLRRTKAA